MAHSCRSYRGWRDWSLNQVFRSMLQSYQYACNVTEVSPRQKCYLHYPLFSSITNIGFGKLGCSGEERFLLIKFLIQWEFYKKTSSVCWSGYAEYIWSRITAFANNMSLLESTVLSFTYPTLLHRLRHINSKVKWAE